MTNAAEVYLWGTRIGTVWTPEGSACSDFEYDRDFLKSGIELSPFKMPLDKRIYSFPELSETDAFHGMPGMLADSLPDRFGNAVINEWLSRHGRDPESFTAVERLCYTGKRGMGALEYVPCIGPESIGGEIDVEEMAEFASEILTGRKSVRLNERDLNLARLIEIGTSAGGARAKAVIAWNEKSGEIRSGQIEAGKDFRHWLIKFDGVEGNGDRGLKDKRQYTLVEYAYYLMARDAGIQMMECRILEKDGRYHFLTLRYDRENGMKKHVQTLAALEHFDYNRPRSCSYEQYAAMVSRLEPGTRGMEQLFRRTVFNFAALNCDDHVKNFSFMMDRNGSWKMTPAYDLTFAYKPDHRWLGRHQMTLNGKSSDVSTSDLVSFGIKNGLTERFCRKTLAEIAGVIKRWPEYAEKCGISEERTEEISRMLNLAGIADKDTE